MSKFDNVMMETAILWSKQSYCKRGQVGAVLAKDGRILVTGFNGTISGHKNECEDEFYECPKCEARETKEENLVHTQLEHAPGAIGYVVKSYCKYCNSIIDKQNVSGSLINMSLNELKNMNIPSNLKPVYKTNEFTLHAEQNVITYAAKSGISTNNCTLYVTTSPCKQCAKLIAQSGISTVVYKTIYRDDSGIQFLRNVGVKVKEYKEDSKQI